MGVLKKLIIALVCTLTGSSAQVIEEKCFAMSSLFAGNYKSSKGASFSHGKELYDQNIFKPDMKL